MTDSPRVMDLKDRAPDWNAFDERLEKIVLGSPGNREERLRVDELPDDLDYRFPVLSHVHLYGLEGVVELPRLPGSVRYLEIRDCPNLVRLPRTWPPKLEVLVIEDCGALVSAPPGRSNLEKLEELSFAGSSFVSADDLQAWIDRAPALWQLDLSRSETLIDIKRWPLALEDLRLDDCLSLEALPERWAPKLRRLQLRNSKLYELPTLPPPIDYLDLSGVTVMRRMPKWRGEHPRTLFLFGSTIEMPPASEHGDELGENVASRTREYFEDIQLVGRGDVKRCKVLVLGNGGAGKTCLSLRLCNNEGEAAALLAKHEAKPEEVRSTHGVQFHPWNPTVRAGTRNVTVNTQVWDFGGQEIYHGTHRLFLSAGTVFVVVWSPDEGAAPVALMPDGREDRRRSLGYWLDYIDDACRPAAPEVVVICSKRGAREDALLQQMEEEAGDRRLEPSSVLFVDSVSGEGEVDAARAAVEASVGRVVCAQGTAVPTYWEIAQDLVQEWTERSQDDEAFAASHRQVGLDQFHDALRAEVARRASPENDEEQRFVELHGAMEDGTFELTEERIERTLGFLTRSGWLFWKRGLFEGRVIIGQRWALDGLYTVLERYRDGKESPVWRQLTDHDGLFTLKDLERWGWRDETANHKERELLLTFMREIGLCFRLIDDEHSKWGRGVYVSLEHLPDADWREAEDAKAATSNRSAVVAVKHDGLHQGHWQRILRQLGERFGTNGRYAQDGALVRTSQGQCLDVRLDLEERGFGGRITLLSGGPGADELEQQVAEAIQAVTRGAIEKVRVDQDVAAAVGEQPRIQQVFLSYKMQPEDAPDGVDYEEPVDRIYGALDAEPDIQPVRSTKELATGESVMTFMYRICNGDFVVAVHSDEYWFSQFCMFELSEFMQSLSGRKQSYGDSLGLIGHVQARFPDVDGQPSPGAIRSAAAQQQVLDYWARFAPEDFRTMFRKFDRAGLKVGIENVVRNDLPKLDGALDLDVAWSSDAADDIIAKLIDAIRSQKAEAFRGAAPKT